MQQSEYRTLPPAPYNQPSISQNDPYVYNSLLPSNNINSINTFTKSISPYKYQTQHIDDRSP